MIACLRDSVVRVPRRKDDFGSSMLQKITQLENTAGIKLGMAQKIILAETGTVEQLLSILRGSSIRVEVVRQRQHSSVITRESVISDYHGRILIKAKSRIFVDVLPSRIRELIESRNQGIGTMIQNCALETFRKITEIGYDPKKNVIFRRYKIVYKKKVAFEIKEEILEQTTSTGSVSKLMRTEQ